MALGAKARLRRLIYGEGQNRTGDNHDFQSRKSRLVVVSYQSTGGAANTEPRKLKPVRKLTNSG
jgi:hypothetical protein